jgi:squalene-associated FAD-dependent desaturase
MNEILIIGGGFAGLAAGVALAGAGRPVRLLEQKPHLGGRARSFLEPATGSVVDNGQHILMGAYHATLRFLEEIGTLDRISFQPGLSVRFLGEGGRLSSLQCPRLPSPWHLLAGVLRSDGFRWREKLEILRLGRVLDSAGSDSDSTAGLSVEEWLTHLGQSERLRRNFWDLFSIAAMNEDPRRAAASIFARVLRLALFSSPQDSRIGIPRRGLSECYAQAAADYMRSRGGQVETGCNVSSFVIVDGVCRGVKMAGGESVEASRVISAVPWFEFVRLLPAELLRSEPFFTRILGLRPAPIISINLWFDRPVTELDFVGLRGTTVQWLFKRVGGDAPGKDYVSLVLSGAHAHIGRAKEELLAVALTDLARVLPQTREAKLVHSLVIKERFATFSPAVDAEALRPTASTPIPGLILAGDWTATGLPATIEGAVQSGYAAAAEVVGAE